MEARARGHKSPRPRLHHKLSPAHARTDCSSCALEPAAYMHHSPPGSSPPFFPVGFQPYLLAALVYCSQSLAREVCDELREMKIQCDACEGAAATVVCCADEAALCALCDVEIHAANKLASKHQRLPLEALSARLPRCDVCQEKAAFIFCVEDRALFCRDCDEPIHVPGTLSGNHQRYLATGIRVGFGSASTCNGADSGGAHDADHHAPPSKAAAEQAPSSQTSASAAAQQVPSPPQFLPQGWAVDDLLQFSDYESSDKMQKESPLGFKELDWFADIDLFQDQTPKAGRMAEVPQLFGSQAVNDVAYYKPSKPAAGMRQSKKARIEVPDDEDDYFIVPDLG